jgi:hypothetical protein
MSIWRKIIFNRVNFGIFLLSATISSLASAMEERMDYQALIKEATADIEKDFSDSWAYTETTRSSEAFLWVPMTPVSLKAIDGLWYR